MFRRLSLLLGVLLLFGFAPPASADYNVIATVPLSGLNVPPPGWDAIALSFLPRLIAVNPASQRVYVSDGASKLYVLEGSSHALTATLPVGGMVAVNASANRIYILGSTSVTVLDGTSHATLATIPVTGAPVAIAVNESAHRFYVLGKGNCTSSADCTGALSIYDGSDHRLIKTISLPHPYSMAVNPQSDRVYIGGSRKKETGSPSVEVVLTVIGGAADPRILETVPMQAGEIPSPFDLVIDPKADRIYAVRLNAVEVVDGTTHAAISRWSNAFEEGSVLHNQLGAMLDPVTGHLIVFRSYTSGDINGSRAPQHEAFYLKGSDGSLLGSLKGYGNLAGIGIHPLTGRIYAHNSHTSKLTVIQDAPAVDTIPPKVTLTFEPPMNAGGWVRATAATVTIHAMDRPGGLGVQGIFYRPTNFYGRLNSNFSLSFEETATTRVYSFKASSASALSYSVKDHAGNTTSASFEIKYDPTKPVSKASVAYLPEGKRQVTLKADDPATNVSPYGALPPSGIGGIWYSLDEGPFTLYSSPLIINDGRRHTLRFYSYDKADNVEEIHNTFDLPEVIGDVNQDSLTDVRDVILVLQAALNLATLTVEQKTAADLSGDGTVDVRDAVLLLKKITGIG
ncbi:MAG: hypothetical protein KY468_11555 [Armatimonadetes bacterium]|nr:hypothetical protein [Armatimonadota bacterium]